MTPGTWMKSYSEAKNLKLKKVMKSFVPEPISCISGFPMYISRIHIKLDLVDPYIYYNYLFICTHLNDSKHCYVSLTI